VNTLKNNILSINAKYNQTCEQSCTSNDIIAFSNEHANAVNIAIEAFRVLPGGYIYWWYPQLVWNIGFIWIDIYYTLWFIWGRAGLVWEVIYFNEYLYNFYYAWRGLFWYFGYYGGYYFWPYWNWWFFDYYWGWGCVWWGWWRIFWWY